MWELLTDRPLVVLTGAGMSTDSGIPDYRGPRSTPRLPMTFQEFIGSAEARQRYWARSHLGWDRMRAAAPNPGHRALARVPLSLCITQNVDGLHEAAGQEHLVALHGRIAEVICLACRRTTSRSALQAELARLNPGHTDRFRDLASLPDGDVALDDTGDFVVPECAGCGGVLKPHVVFFGENVPGERVARCYAAVDALGSAGCLLVLGSSLTVLSGLRFVKRAAKQGTSIVIVNRGETRGDSLATWRVDRGVGDFAVELASRRQ